MLLKFMAIWDCRKNVGCCVLYVACCVFCVFVCCVFCVVCCVLVVVCCMLYLCVVCYQCVVCCVFCVLYVIQSVLFRGGGGGSGGEGRRKRIQHSKQKPIKAPHNNVGNKANHEQAGTQKHPKTFLDLQDSHFFCLSQGRPPSCRTSTVEGSTSSSGTTGTTGAAQEFPPQQLFTKTASSISPT